MRASVPLSLAGFGAAAFAELTHALEPFHVVPLQGAGGAGRATAAGPSRFEDGGSIAVELIRGDVSAAGTGTVTRVEGDKVLAFGHPMFNVGEIYLPIASAEIHTFMSALSSSFKMASPLKEIGSLIAGSPVRHHRRHLAARRHDPGARHRRRPQPRRRGSSTSRWCATAS